MSPAAGGAPGSLGSAVGSPLSGGAGVVDGSTSRSKLIDAVPGNQATPSCTRPNFSVSAVACETAGPRTEKVKRPTSPGLVSLSTPVGRFWLSQSGAASALSRSCGSMVPRWVSAGVQVTLPVFLNSTQASTIWPASSVSGIEWPVSCAVRVMPAGGGVGGVAGLAQVEPLANPVAGDCEMRDAVCGP